MIRTRRSARSAEESIMKRKTTTGAVARIRASSEGKCGGAVEKQRKKQLDANSVSTKVKRTRRMTWTLMISCRTSLGS